MKTRTALGALAATGLLALSGCAASGPDIRTDYDANADFAWFSTFAFMDREERGVARSYDTIADRRVIAAVTRELEGRGYRLVERAPDLLVNFAISTEDVQEIRSVPSTMMPPPWYGWRAGYYYPWPAYTYETWVDTYQRGTLFIDLVDPERRQLVWEGSAVGRVTEADRGDPGAAVDSAVSEIFARYPFRPGVPRQP